MQLTVTYSLPFVSVTLVFVDLFWPLIVEEIRDEKKS